MFFDLSDNSPFARSYRKVMEKKPRATLHLRRILDLSGAPDGFGKRVIDGKVSYTDTVEYLCRGWIAFDGEGWYADLRGKVYSAIYKGAFGKWDIPKHILDAHAEEMRMQGRKKMIVHKDNGLLNDLKDLKTDSLRILASGVHVGDPSVKIDEILAVLQPGEDPETRDALLRVQSWTRQECIEHLLGKPGERSRNVVYAEYAESIINSYTVMVFSYLEDNWRWKLRSNVYRLKHKQPRLIGLSAVAEAVFKREFARKAVARYDINNPNAAIGTEQRGTNNTEYYIVMNGESKRVPYSVWKNHQKDMNALRNAGIHEVPISCVAIEPTPRSWRDTLCVDPYPAEPGRLSKAMDDAMLTDRERECFGMLTRGYRQKQIADVLGIPHRQAKYFVESARKKLQPIYNIDAA